MPSLALSRGDFRPKSLSADLLLGAVNGLDNVLWGYTFASLIFTGILAPYLPLAITIALVSSGVVSLVIALTSGIRINIAGSEEQAVAILAAVAAILNRHAGEFASPDAAAATMFAVIALASLLLGVTYLLAARFNLGLLIQLMPFPVVCGFLAGTGWLLATAGIAMTAGVTVDVLDPAPVVSAEALMRWVPALALGAAIYGLTCIREHSLVLPVSLVAAAAAFFAFAAMQGATLADLQAGGWVFDVATLDHTRGLASLDVENLSWPMVGEVLPEVLTLVLLGLLAASFQFSALELGTGAPVELRREFTSHGVANLASTLCLGLPGSTQVGSTLLARHLGGSSRLLPLLVGALVLVAAVAGQGIVGYVPKLVMGGLVFLVAVQFIHEYLVLSSRQMNVSDAVVVWTIFGVIVFVGFVTGVVVGIVLTSLLFIVRYSKIGILGSSYTLSQIASSVERAAAEQKLINEAGGAARLFNLRGFLFFGTANLFFEQMKAECAASPGQTYFIFNFRRVYGIDSTAAKVFIKILNLLAGKQITPVFCGLSPELARSFALARLPQDAGLVEFDSVEHALKWVEENLLAENEPRAAAASATAMLAQILGDGGKAEMLAAVMERVDLAEGEYLFRQGDEETCLYLIASGTIQVQLETAAKTIPLREFRAGSFVGEMAAYSSGKRRSASAIATGPGALYRLDIPRLKAAHGAELEAMMHELVARLLAARLGFMNERLAADL